MPRGAVDHDVFGLQVAVDHADGVKEGERQANLREKEARQLLGEARHGAQQAVSGG